MVQPLPDGLLLAYYGDDFTGSTDALEAFAVAGISTVLFLRPPDAAALQRFPGVRCIGLAGQSRGRSPDWMREHLLPDLRCLAALAPPVLQYKVCSTFDSSPAIGSIGCAIDLGVPLMPGRWSPLTVGAPRLGRFTAFGHLFAMADGIGHRLDRHPTMSRHPVTPMHEADLLRHLADQTPRRSGLVDFTRLKARDGAATLEQLIATAGDGEPPIILLDILDDETLAEAGRLVWEHRGPGVFAAASSGLQYALVACWRHQGLLPAPEAPAVAGAAGRVAAVSGSCSPITARQIERAADCGYATLRLDTARLLSPQGDQAVADVVDAACVALARGRSPLVYSALGPDDPTVRGFDAAAQAAGLSRAEAASRTGEALAQVMRRLLDRTPDLRRIAVAGGDSSGDVASELGIHALTVAASLAPGAPLCRAWSDDPRRDGLEIVLKGGQMGGPDFFAAVRDGAAR